MHAEIKNDRLHLFPSTVVEFQQALWWEHLNSPVQVFVHRPVEAISAYRLQLTNETITNGTPLNLK